MCTDSYTLFHYYNINNYYFRDFQGNTALHLACLSRKISSAQTLLRMGANPMILNRYGYSALSIRSTHKCSLVSQCSKNGTNGEITNVGGCIVTSKFRIIKDVNDVSQQSKAEILSMLGFADNVATIKLGSSKALQEL